MKSLKVPQQVRLAQRLRRCCIIVEFVHPVIDHLPENEVVEHEDFYDSPFVDVAATDPESLFRPDHFETLIQILVAVRSTASAAVVGETITCFEMQLIQRNIRFGFERYFAVCDESDPHLNGGLLSGWPKCVDLKF